jgi:hypothetical protein
VTSWAGHQGLNNWNKTAETGRTRQVSLMGSLDRTARTWQCLENVNFIENSTFFRKCFRKRIFSWILLRKCLEYQYFRENLGFSRKWKFS